MNLDISDASPREALRRIFQGTNYEYVVDPDVPDDVRITLKAPNVRLDTALDLVSQAAGIGWRLQWRNGKRLFRFGKTLPSPRGGAAVIDLQELERMVTSLPPLQLNRVWIPMMGTLTEERSTFTCPHCKERATVIRERRDSRCPQCGRMLQPEWQFCPTDGTRRPSAPPEWRFCPNCGKPVPERGGKTGGDR